MTTSKNGEKSIDLLVKSSITGFNGLWGICGWLKEHPRVSLAFGNNGSLRLKD